ncbi:MAG: hypothetical protein IJW08_06050 [Lentisphaeria bacterium]|nr:hypothetical protein [Lentisphaeria bacterium]MBR7119940.1 hypothetical protein [Lentisphaeria bacterium]
MQEERNYMVPLSRDELLTAAEIAAMLTNAIEEKKAVFIAQRNEFRESIKSLNEELRNQLDKLSSKRELRLVTLDIEYNTPEEGKKTIMDAKTGVVYDIVAMTDEDKENLFAQPLQNESDDSVRRRRGIPEWQGNPMSAICMEKADAPEVCAVCKECHSVLHIDREKPICGNCRERKNKPNLEAIERLKNYWNSRGSTAPKFRAAFGHGCSSPKRDTTCFRFMLPSGSWGNPVYLAGDYTYTGSQAESYYRELKKEGWAEG